MRNSPSFTTLLALAFLALAFVLPGGLAAADGAPSASEIRQRLTPVYRSLQNDPQFLALAGQLNTEEVDEAAVERYLAYLPLSPLEMLEIKMHLGHFELMIPETLRQWHRRWIELHREQATEFYGKAYVAEALAARSIAMQPQEGAAPSAEKMGTVGTNRNVASAFAPAPLQYQGEIQVAVNPNNTQQIVAAANTSDSIGGTCGVGIQAVFYSSDGGATWGYTCAPNETAYGLNCTKPFLFGSDPAVNWDGNGNVYLEHMMLCTADFNNIQFSIVVARSSNGGVNWSGQGIVINSWPTINRLEDKNFYAIDNNPGSPFFGRHYTCWDRNNNEKSAYSTDSGATWTEVDIPASPSTGAGFATDLACELAVSKDGTVHVIFDTLRCFANCNNEQMFYARSTNGGLSWSAPVLVRDFNLVGFSNLNCPAAQEGRCINPFGAIDVDNSGGACDGYLYATFTDYGDGGVNTSDVFIVRSIDNGATWSAPVRVNDDGIFERVQFHPFLMVDQASGNPVVAWHDARNDTQNRAVDFFAARSTDCGLTVEANTQASAPSTEFLNSTISSSNENALSNPNRNPNQFGEYLGLDVLTGKAYMAWTDSRQFFPTFNNQRENVGFATVDFGTAYHLLGPAPGTTGVTNNWSTSGGTSGATTFFLYGFTAGAVQVPGCPVGVTVGMSDVNILGSPVSNANGIANTSLFVGAGASGVTVLLQAVELSTCKVSNLISYTFP